MKTITEATREVPVLAETDVLVVGSGPGGLSAALASGREGVDTLLVERFGCLGANTTVVGVEGIGWYRKDGTTDVEGIGVDSRASPPPSRSSKASTLPTSTSPTFRRRS